MREWANPDLPYGDRVREWVNDRTWGTTTVVTIAGSSLPFFFVGDVKSGAIALAVLGLAITVPPAAPNAGKVLGVVGGMAALALLVWLWVTVSPTSLLAVFIVVCLVLLVLHLASRHAENDEWRLDGASVALLIGCLIAGAVLVITSNDGESRAGQDTASSTASPDPSGTATPAGEPGPGCTDALASPPVDGSEVEPANNERASATAIAESYTSLQGTTGAQNDRDWAAFCVEREAAVTVRVVNPGTPDTDCEGLEAQLKGASGQLIGEPLYPGAETASTLSRLVKPSDTPYAVLITESSGNDCRWLLDIEPLGVLAGEASPDVMPCLPLGEGLPKGSEDNSTFDRAEVLGRSRLGDAARPRAQLERFGVLVSPDEERWFVMCAVRPEALSIRVDNPDFREYESCDLRLDLLDAHGELLAESEEAAKTLSLTYNVKAGRRYYVKLIQEESERDCRWALRIAPATALDDRLAVQG